MPNLSYPVAVTRETDTSTYLLLAGGFAGLYEMVSHAVPFGSGFEMVAIAENLAQSGSYANPFSVLATGPTAANPPLYPLFLALLFKIFRSTALVLFAATLATIFANACTATLLPRISEVFYGDRRPGIVAAVFWILAVPLWPCWDVSFTVLVLIVFCLKTDTDLESQRLGVHAFTSGLLASALFLLNPSTILITIPWLAWFAYRGRRMPKHAMAYCGFVICVTMVAGCTWAGRNRIELGKAVIRTNLGLTLYASNNDCASSSLLASEASNCYQTYHPNTNIHESAMIRMLGEVEYDRRRVHDSGVWMESHPHRFLVLTIERLRDFWFPRPIETPFKCAVVWIATLLSIPGLFKMIQRWMGLAVFVCSTLLIYPLMYYVVVSSLRYRLPVLWLSLLPCGWFLVDLWDRRAKAHV